MTKPRIDTRGYVYVVRAGDRFKVGHTQQPHLRLQKIICRSGGSVLLVEPGLGWHEKQAHYNLTDYRIGRTEWFRWFRGALSAVRHVLRLKPQGKPKKMVSTIAKQMRRTRLDRKLTQAELADALGISQEMVSMIESGTKEMPDALRPIVQRWMATGKVPSKMELGARYRNPGR